MQTVNVIAPAKVNLFLGIGQRREDGYHDVTTVMHALAMHDKLAITQIGCGEHVVVVEPNDPAQPERQEEVEVEPGSGLSVTVRNLWFSGIAPIDIPDERNLVYQAIHALAKAIGREEDEAIRVVTEKRIPYQAGLGGGSADAAAAILGVAHLWGVDCVKDDELLQDVARQLGADVRFFIHGGCALLEGRGDWLESRLEPRKDSVAVIRPEGGVSTAEAYRLFDESPRFFSEEELESVRNARRAVDVQLGNNLQEPAFVLHPDIPRVFQLARDVSGVSDVLLCGSGSAVFAVCDSFECAQSVAAMAQRAGYWSRATSFSGVRAAILPSNR